MWKMMFLDSMSMVLSDKHEAAINQLKINHQLNPDPVTEYLYSNQVLTSEQIEVIKSKPTKNAKSQKLLDMISEPHKDWMYYCLLDVLDKTGQNHVTHSLMGSKYVHVK